MEIASIVNDHRELISKTRRDLHRIPEVGFQEHKTSAYIEDYLRREGLEVTSKIAGTGVVGLLRGGAPGPTLMIRSDIDALPLTETTGLPFASEHPGVMHACGHDAHMAMLLGAATVLSTYKTELKGNIKFVFQPAEEGPGGAEPMIEEGVMENPTVDYSLGCHVWPSLPEGYIGVKAGPIMAAMERFEITINGKGGHGAMPHLCVDALEVATQVVSAIQRVVSRQTNPMEPVVVTIGTLHAGTNFNIIPETAEMTGTTRTFNRDLWAGMEGRLKGIIKGVCDSMGAGFEFRRIFGYPPTVNDPEMCDLVRRCASAVVGEDNVAEPEPTMGGEDMSYFLERSKGCYFFLGVGREGGAPIHNPAFDIPEEAMATGVEIFRRAALELLT